MMTLEQFNKQYKYKSDLEKYGTSLFDIWEIPKIEDGFYYGDCEDYCIFLKHNIPQFENWDYYYCKLDGVGHCVLIKNTDVIDCNVREVLTLEQYCKMFTITELRKYSKFEILSKILFSKGFLLWKKFSE